MLDNLSLNKCTQEVMAGKHVINMINNQLVTDEKSKLVKTEKETICDINMVIFCYFN